MLPRQHNLPVAIFTERFPNAAIGAACGLSKIVVLDIDPRNGGDDTFDRLVDEVGASCFDACPKVITPSHGLHLWFRAPARPIPNGNNRLGPGIDVQGKGLNGNGLGVVLPPSKHQYGEYAWKDGEFPDLSKMPILPEVLIERISSVRTLKHTTRPQQGIAKLSNSVEINMVKYPKASVCFSLQGA